MVNKRIYTALQLAPVRRESTLLALYFALAAAQNAFDIKVMPLKILFLISPEFKLRSND